jgi:hypothetical protein
MNMKITSGLSPQNATALAKLEFLLKINRLPQRKSKG